MQDIFDSLPENLQKRAVNIFSTESFQDIRKLQVEKPDNFRWIFHVARKFLTLHEYRIAEHFYNITLERQPYVVYAHAGLAVCHYNLKQIGPSLKNMQRAIGLLVQYELDTMETYGVVPSVWRTSIPVKGLAFVKDTVYINQAAYLSLEHTGDEDFPNYDEEFEKMVLQPSLFFFGNHLRVKGLYQEATICFRLAIRIKPNDTLSQTNLGTALAESGDLNNALVELEKAIILDPKDAVAHSGLGVIYSKLGNTLKALEYLTKAVNLRNGDYPFAEEQIENIRLASEKHYIYSELVSFEEDQQHEFKGFRVAQQKMNDRLLVKKIVGFATDYINAFLNTNDGTLYLGIEDDGMVSGIQLNREQRDDLRKNISQAVNNTFQPSVDPTLYKIEFVPIFGSTDELFVIEINVSKGSERVYVISSNEKDGIVAYLRQGGGKFAMSLDTLKERLKS